MGFFDSLLKPAKSLLGMNNPYRAGEGMLSQIPGVGREHYGPFIEQGKAIQPELTEEYRGMAKDPASFLNALMGDYQSSPGYEFRRDQQLEAARNSAAAGGFAGTPFDAQQEMQLVDAIAGADIGSWLDRVLGVKTGGLGGLEGISGRGFQASTGLGDYIGSAMGQQAGAAIGGKAAQNAAIQDLVKSIMGSASYMAGSGGGGGGGGGGAGGGFGSIFGGG